MTALRALLFVPAGNERLLASALRHRPDAVILDLEDAVAAADKPAARAALRAMQARVRAEGLSCLVRVNAPLCELIPDVEAIDPGLTDALILPKVTDCRPLDNAAELTAGSLPLIALIESPTALRNLNAIAAHPRVMGLMLGSEDFSARLGIDPNGGGLTHPATLIALAAAAEGRLAIGFPGSIGNFRDLDLYARQLAQARALGFHTAAAIHPAQLPAIRAAFAPSEAELAWARAVLAQALDGVSAHDGQMIDAPVLARARTLLDLAGD
ncbi:CoA ester lyase [bacterium]|nr:CoA ester lyase [bacterium]